MVFFFLLLLLLKDRVNGIFFIWEKNNILFVLFTEMMNQTIGPSQPGPQDYKTKTKKNKKVRKN